MTTSTRCAVDGCLRVRIPEGARCDTHTREALSNAWKPAWVIRAEEHRLPVRTVWPQ